MPDDRTDPAETTGGDSDRNFSFDAPGGNTGDFTPVEPTGEFTPAPRDTGPTEPTNPGAFVPPSEATGEFTPNDPTRTGGGGGKAKPGPGRVVSIPGYQLLGELGRGGMGVVYKARQIKADRLVALKLMLNADHAGTTARARFDTEAQAVARLQHPNIVGVYEVGEVNGNPYFTLEYVPGTTLAGKLRETLPPPREAAALAATLARAMGYAHKQNIIHRDIKPANILVSPSGVPKIADFGLARKTEDDSQVTRAGTVVGTPSYMPPEQAAGDTENIGPAADIYSLGALFYEVLTGRPPFKGSNLFETLTLVKIADPVPPLELRPKLPKDLSTICLKCLQKDPAKRYATADDLADDLQRFLEDRPILARPAGPVERSVRWVKRNPLPTALIASLLVLFAGAAAAAVVVNDQKNTIAAQKVEVEDERDKATARLELVRGTVSKFVNDVPRVLENQTEVATVRPKLLALMDGLIADAGGSGAAEIGLIADRGKAAVLLRGGEDLLLAGKPAAAQVVLQQAYDLAAASARAPDADPVKEPRNVALTATRLADALVDLRAVEPAVPLYKSAAVAWKKLADRPDAGPEAKLDFARAYAKLAGAEKAARDFPNALDHGTKGAALAEPLADANPAATPLGAAARRALAQNLAQIGLAQKALDRADDAAASLARSLKLYEALPAPTDADKAEAHAARLELAVHLLVRLKRPADAKPLFERAAQYSRGLIETDTYRRRFNDLAFQYYAAGTAAAMTGDDEAAAADFFARCLALREIQWRHVSGDPAVDKLGIPYLNARLNRMLALGRCGRHAEAAAEAAAEAEAMKQIAARAEADPKVRGGINVPEFYRQIASGYALAADSPGVAAAAKAQYQDAGLDALRQAVALGHKSAKQFLAFEPDLDGLRGRKEFTALAAAVQQQK